MTSATRQGGKDAISWHGSAWDWYQYRQGALAIQQEIGRIIDRHERANAPIPLRAGSAPHQSHRPGLPAAPLSFTEGSDRPAA